MPSTLEDGRFDGQAPHHVHDPSGFRVWFLEPAGLLTQVGDQSRVGPDVARWVASHQAELDTRRAESDSLLYFHDWRRLDGYDAEARQVMTDWALRVRRDTECIVIALAPEARIVRMGVGVAKMALQLAGFDLEVVDELGEALRRHGVRAARG